jgi:hypothetical protein
MMLKNQITEYELKEIDVDKINKILWGKFAWLKYLNGNSFTRSINHHLLGVGSGNNEKSVPKYRFWEMTRSPCR